MSSARALSSSHADLAMDSASDAELAAAERRPALARRHSGSRSRSSLISRQSLDPMDSPSREKAALADSLTVLR